MIGGLGFRVGVEGLGAGLAIWDLGFRVWGLGLTVLGFRVWGLEFRAGLCKQPETSEGTGEPQAEVVMGFRV